MYKALYRKYRPLVFSDVVGQEHITTTLKRQVERGSVSHAYLFTGSRGTGKTTCAKILARAVNCLEPVDGNPCGKCKNCIGILNDSVPDVVEIDAASNNGVDHIRDLRDRIVFAPAQAKYRVYIIDEVHMLSAAASNALLKTLEEPPEHAVFILATTEVQSLLPTILSRCQRFDFKRIEPEVIANRLKFVANSEQFALSDGAAELIAELADGGMRDALSILDLCTAAGNDITEELVNSVCGRASEEYLFTLCGELLQNDTAAALETVARLHADSVDMGRLCRELCDFWRKIMLICAGVEPKAAVGSTENTAKKYAGFAKNLGAATALRFLKVFEKAYSEMDSGLRRSVLEMAIIKLCTKSADSSPEALAARIEIIERKLQGLSALPSTTPFADGTVQAKAPALQADAANAKGDKISSEKQPVTTVEESSFSNVADADEAGLKAEESAAESETPQAAAHAETPYVNSQCAAETPFTNWGDVISACYKTAPVMFGMLNGSTATVSGNRVIIHSPSSQLRHMLAKTDGINYKGLVAAISSVSGKELVPVMEKEQTEIKNDPMMGFLDRLNNLGEK